MLLRDLMWKVFQSTGQIEAYLIYCSCPAGGEQPTALSDHTRPVVLN